MSAEFDPIIEKTMETTGVDIARIKDEELAEHVARTLHDRQARAVEKGDGSVLTPVAMDIVADEMLKDHVWRNASGDGEAAVEQYTDLQSRAVTAAKAMTDEKAPAAPEEREYTGKYELLQGVELGKDEKFTMQLPQKRSYDAHPDIYEAAAQYKDEYGFSDADIEKIGSFTVLAQVYAGARPPFHKPGFEIDPADVDMERTAILEVCQSQSGERFLTLRSKNKDHGNRLRQRKWLDDGEEFTVGRSERPLEMSRLVSGRHFTVSFDGNKDLVVQNHESQNPTTVLMTPSIYEAMPHPPR